MIIGMITARTAGHQIGVWCSEHLRARELGETAMPTSGFPAHRVPRGAKWCAV